jgi:hypothetical protein
MKARFHTLMLAACMASAGAQAKCLEWDFTGGWIALQGSYRVKFDLTHPFPWRSGTASVWEEGHVYWSDRTPVPLPDRAPDHWSNPKEVKWTVVGEAIQLTTAWGGVYTGRIDAGGSISGYTIDTNHPESYALWHSDRRMACGLYERVEPPAPPHPQPILTPNEPSMTSGSSGGKRASSIFGSRPATTPAPAPNPATMVASPSCQSGFVPRFATGNDRVCVTPASHRWVEAENRHATARRAPQGGAYGPATCKTGFVWRVAVPADLVCVSPERRRAVAEENQLAASRRRG